MLSKQDVNLRRELTTRFCDARQGNSRDSAGFQCLRKIGDARSVGLLNFRGDVARFWRKHRNSLRRYPSSRLQAQHRGIDRRSDFAKSSL